MITILVGIVIAFVVIAGLYFGILRRANPPLRSGEAKIGTAVFNIEVVSTTIEQARGLSFRASLPETSGMLFTFGTPGIQNFWMKDMNFPIDIIWIANGKVVGFAENAMPMPDVALWNLKIYSSPDGTDSVIEVNAGTVAKDNIKVGDSVRVGI